MTTSGNEESGAPLGDLLVAAQHGDADAYRAFLFAVIPFARAVARRRCWSGDMVEDVVQDTLLTIHRVRHTYEAGRPIKPWLAAIVVRRSIDAVRRRERLGRREVHDAVALETFADPAANEPTGADNRRSVERMTASLSQGQREAIELVKIREMTLADASRASGQSVASLKVNIHRAMKKLRSEFGRGDGE